MLPRQSSETTMTVRCGKRSASVPRTWPMPRWGRRDTAVTAVVASALWVSPKTSRPSARRAAQSPPSEMTRANQRRRMDTSDSGATSVAMRAPSVLMVPPFPAGSSQRRVTLRSPSVESTPPPRPEEPEARWQGSIPATGLRQTHGGIEATRRSGRSAVRSLTSSYDHARCQPFVPLRACEPPLGHPPTNGT